MPLTMYSNPESQKRLRIRLLCAAYYYYNDPDFYYMSDDEFDRLCKGVILTIYTGNSVLDEWFIKHFDASTGMWVNQLPVLEANKLYWLCEYIKRLKENVNTK